MIGHIIGSFVWVKTQCGAPVIPSGALRRLKACRPCVNLQHACAWQEVSVLTSPNVSQDFGIVSFHKTSISICRPGIG